MVDVFGLGDADGGVDEQRPADSPGCPLGELLVDAVHGVARLEGDDVAVTHGREALARLRRREAQRAVEAVPRQVEHLGPAGEVVRRPALGLAHQGVRGVGAAQHRAHLAHAVVPVDVVDLEHGEHLRLFVDERHLARVPQGAAGHRHGQRDGEHGAVVQAHLAQHRLVVVARHEAVDRRERAHGQHLEVVLAAQRERDLGQVPGAVVQRLALRLVVDDEIDEAPPEGADELGGRGVGCHGLSREPGG